ncbi:N-6 DNA methylase [Pseudomonas aeruginosa]|nr:SAM-dependent DNA methyltransferase [Pseudomonas aeruginosa]
MGYLEQAELQEGFENESSKLASEIPFKPSKAPETINYESRFSLFSQEAISIAQKILNGEKPSQSQAELEALIGEKVGSELKRQIPLAKRQEMGAFFTGVSLREKAFSYLDSPYSVLDPACGAGDLLLSYANKLPVRDSLEETLISWEDFIYGFELEESFLRMARARLVILAYLKGLKSWCKSALSLNNIFRNIVLGDALATAEWPKTEHIVLNPPYIYMKAEEKCPWTTGSVSAAAVFIDHCLKKGSHASVITAILPDVLRTGSRYRRWRELVGKSRLIKRTQVHGAFDSQVDVDVFILELHLRPFQIGHLQHQWTCQLKVTDKTVKDLFSVTVGSVVPHRDREEGMECVYIHPKDAPPWGEITTPPGHRKYFGATHQAPFVVIRRTSSPSDKNRAIGTIVNCEGNIAIENHLIILKPLSKKLSDCQRLLEVLKLKSTSEWLNDRIRCRHLTVSAIKDLPWAEQKP